MDRERRKSVRDEREFLFVAIILSIAVALFAYKIGYEHGYDSHIIEMKDAHENALRM